MIKGFSCIFLLFFFLSCRQSNTQIKSQTKAATTQVSDETNIDLERMREDYILSYNKPTGFESEHKGNNGEKVKVIGKYYCLFDSRIVVPGKYNLDDTTKTFRTHNFVEDISIIINGDTAIKKTITKQVFEHILPQYLKDYAVLLEPEFEGYDSENGTFDFNVSISIPLSDIGEAKKLTITKGGQIKVSNRY